MRVLSEREDASAGSGGKTCLWGFIFRKPTLERIIKKSSRRCKERENEAHALTRKHEKPTPRRAKGNEIDPTPLRWARKTPKAKRRENALLYRGTPSVGRTHS